MRKSTAILLSAVMVMSVVMPGLAVAQTDDPTYSRTFESFPEHVLVNQENMTGDFVLEVSTTGVPGREGDNVALTRGRYGPGSEQWIQFNNEKAYENVTLTVTVHGSGEPKFANGSEFGATGAASNIVMFAGGTGGDRDLTCDSGEQMSTMTNPFVNVVDCTAPVDNNVDENLDAEQAKLDIWQSGHSQKLASDNFKTSMENYLQDTQTQALILAKNAYIRSLNNGSTEASAKADAQAAIDEYYTTKQVQLVNQWNLQASHFSYLEGVERNESGISETFIYGENIEKEMNDASDYARFTPDLKESSISLLNGSSITTQQYELMQWDESMSTVNNYYYVNLGDTPSSTQGGDGIRVSAPNSDTSEYQYVDFHRYSTIWSSITTQEANTADQIDTLVNNTYSEYQAGEINNTDLIDPYLFAQEFSPGDEYQGWAAAQLTMLGTNSPEAMDSIGEFNVSTENGNFSGILMSQENPASGQFAVNTTYDPSQIGGTQYVVTDSQVHELTTNFSISSITTSDGETRQNATIVNNTYETADVNTTQLQQMYEDLAFLRAQIEARQQALGGGGGGPLAGMDTQSIAIIAVAGAAILLLQN